MTRLHLLGGVDDLPRYYHGLVEVVSKQQCRREDRVALGEGPAMARVILGAAVMLFVAALIEGFWSPSGAPTTYKFIVGAVFWAFIIFYLAFSGRQKIGTSRETP